jgi:hypothetical protein
VRLLNSGESTQRLKRYIVLTLSDRPELNPNKKLKLYLNEQKIYVSYATGYISFRSQYLLNIYMYYRFCRLCIINVLIKF